MPRLTSLLILVSIARLCSVVTAEKQIPFGPNPAAVEVMPHRQDAPFRAQDISCNVPDLPESTIKNTTSTHIEANSPEPPTEPQEPEPSLPWLITSPYTAPAHLTNLSTLPLPSRLLTLALTQLSPTNASYATTPYANALNWPTIFETLKSLSDTHNHTWTTTIFYVVEFRSKLKTDIDRELLFKLDRESHREATASGGLLKYWFGRTSDDVEGRNLATCLWVKKEDAVAGGNGPWHKKARSVIPQMYESIDVRGLKLTVDDDVNGWRFEPWVGSH